MGCWHGQLLTILIGHTAFVSSVAFSPDGSKLASGSYDHTVILWDVSQQTGPRPNIKIDDDEMDDDEMDDGEMDEGEMDEGEEDEGELAFGFAGAVEDQAYTAGTAISALVLPEATGGEGEVTYRVSDLPAGLSFDAATRTISGTPKPPPMGPSRAPTPAQDSAGAATTLTFSITVNPALSFGDFFDLFGGAGGG